MKKCFLTTLILLPILLVAAQYDNFFKKITQYRKEAALLRNELELLNPGDFKEDLKIFENVIAQLENELKRNDLPNRIRKDKTRVKQAYEDMVPNLRRLNEMWGEVNPQLDSIDKKLDGLYSLLKKNELKKTDYESRLDGIKSSLGELKSTKKELKNREKKILVGFINAYFPNNLLPKVFIQWANRTAVSTFIKPIRMAIRGFIEQEVTKQSDSLRQQNEDLRQKNDRLRKDSFELEGKTKNLLNDHYLDSIALEAERKSIKDENTDLKSMNMELESTSLKAQLTLDSIEQESRLKKSSLEMKSKEMSSISSNLKKSKEENILLEKKNEILKKKNESLNLEIFSKKADLKKKKLQYNLSLLSLLILSIFSLLVLLRNRTQIIKSRKEITNAYLQLESTKDLLQSRSEQLELSNQELEVKKEQLELSNQELHHRTKNNLQQISSLVDLQAAEIEDKNTQEFLVALEGRIETIKKIHEKLYKDRSKKLTTVNIADYLEGLAKDIVDGDAHLKLDLQPLEVKTDHATFIGLVINELITNAKKYAFPSTPNPKLSIKIVLENQQLKINVKDNGPGFFEGFSMEKLSSFGLKSIVEPLVSHRWKSGKLEMLNEKGALIKIELPFDSSKKQLIT